MHRLLRLPLSGRFANVSLHARAVGLLLLLGAAPVASTLGQSAATYQLTASSGAFSPLTGGVAVPAVLGDDVVSGSLPIGFAFPFDGTSYTTFQASSNGLLGFGGSLTNAGANLGNSFTSAALTGGSLPVLAPFWTDLGGYSGTRASAQYATTGTAPNRVLTMEWLDYKDLNGDADQYISFQVKLYETSGRVEYVYRRGPGGEAGDAAIGLKTTDGSFISLTSVSTTPTFSTTASYNRLNRPATGQVYTLLPATTPLATAKSLPSAAVTVFPNPAHGSFVVRVAAVPQAAPAQVELLNSLGQVVYRQTSALHANGTQLTITPSALATGVYLLRLTVGSETLIKRVVLAV